MQDSDPNINALYAYDLKLQRWDIVQTGPVRPEWRVSHSSLFYNNELYIFYGLVFKTATALSTVWKFNFLDHQWVLVSNITNSGFGASALVQNEKLAYFMYGKGDKIYNFVFYLDLSEIEPTRHILSDNWDFPTKRTKHCSLIMNDKIFIFGGLSDAGAYLNDVWFFDITANLWNNIETSGDIPAGRASVGCTNMHGNGILIFGGTDGIKNYNDLFYFDGNLYTWRLINPASSTIPSPRYSSCLVGYQYTTYILGGIDGTGLVTDLWAYDYTSSLYYWMNSNEALQIHLANYQCWIDFGSNAEIYIVGGLTANYNPSQYVYKVNVTESNGVYTSSTSIFHETQTALSAQSAMVQSGDYILLFFGSYYRSVVNSWIFVLNLNTLEEYTVSFDSEFCVYDHTAVHYGDSIYIFGGSSAASGSEVGFNADSPFFKLTREAGDLLYIPCSSGTLEPDCIPCPEGYYFQDAQCVACPAGKFSQEIASVSILQCTPCAFGTYNSKVGASYCIDCPTTNYCPIGSSILMNYLQIKDYSSIQPAAYTGPTESIGDFVNHMWYTAFAIAGLIMFFTVFYRGISTKVRDLDLYVDQHDQELDIPVVFRKTSIGGFFSIVFLLFAGIVIVGSCLSYFLDNVTESKSLVPTLLLESYVSASILEITISFYVYGGTCVKNSTECQDGNYVQDSSIAFSSKTVKCTMVAPTCQVYILYTGFAISGTAAVQIQMREFSASATAMSVNMTVTSSIPNQESSVFLCIFSKSDFLIFIGNSPTVVTYQFTPSVMHIQVFLSSSSAWSSATGYHISVDRNPVLGSLKTQEE